MADALGVDDSEERVVDRRDASRAVRGRRRFSVSYANGGRLDLGRRTAVMGVINATPDSFSDGGRNLDPAKARDTALEMVDDGADLIDVGGESTRPRAAAVDQAEQIRRVIPAIEAIRRETDVRISVDTTQAAVARRAFDAGADMLNDVSALADPAMLPLLLTCRAPAVLMHMRGTPSTMQQQTDYDDVVTRVIDFLRDRSDRAIDAGLTDDKILLDPGIGFGKSTAGNLEILRRLTEFQTLCRPILIGASRKRFIGAILDLPVEERLEGSLALAAFAVAGGAHVVRVHDVRATTRVVRMIDAIHDEEQ